MLEQIAVANAIALSGRSDPIARRSPLSEDYPSAALDAELIRFTVHALIETGEASSAFHVTT